MESTNQNEKRGRSYHRLRLRRMMVEAEERACHAGEVVLRRIVAADGFPDPMIDAAFRSIVATYCMEQRKMNEARNVYSEHLRGVAARARKNKTP